VDIAAENGGEPHIFRHVTRVRREKPNLRQKLTLPETGLAYELDAEYFQQRQAPRGK
jgi:hypothetical protein